MDSLASASPVRGIIGTIRNIVDFGAFIDFGGPNDGLLHTSKLGPLKLSRLLIGQQVGVDILCVNNGKVSLGVSGLNFQPDINLHKSRHTRTPNQNMLSTKRSMSTKSSGRPTKRRRKFQE